jgi:hypothetical protein
MSHAKLARVADIVSWSGHHDKVLTFVNGRAR